MKKPNPPVGDQRVESPCVQICVLERESDMCIGCGRTLDEIARWSRLDFDQRSLIVDVLDARLTDLRRARAKNRPARARRRQAAISD
ncbi:MAG: DUF1289 domain-containing protein [Pseudomonadota bacterium]